MKITRITIWHVPLESHTAYNMASGKKCETVETVVLRIETDAGIDGWGEACPIPHYLPAYARGIRPAIEEMAPLLIGSDPVGPEAVMARLDAHLIGHPYAKSPIDIALWDITAKVAGLPLHTLLGGRRARDLPLYHSITCIEPDEMARIAKDAYAQGIRQFQAKLGVDDDCQADAERLTKVRAAVGDGPLVYGDWNCGASRLDAIRVGRAVSHLDIMLEQPCATLEDCAAVKAATGLPMKIDECAHDMESLLKGYKLQCMDAVAIKLSKMGGVSASRRARDLCVYLGARMCIEDTWGSDVTTAALLHLGAATEPKAVMNVCDLSGYVAPRLVPGGPTRKEGRIVPPEGPGLGVVPDLDVLGTPAAQID
ncbi:mandelate racemase/muconate lactonizing enzyme family protein [Hoeflea sp.]|uniref:mandelate racemase/muconate lactonizing enzyme family protein n=1 Tax=Hoeflea sp. TaxID=1940281 RepID=UPI003B01B801